MHQLDDVAAMQQKDPSHVLQSIEQLGDQCIEAWTDASKCVFPEHYTHITSIVFSGMGGSALGAYAIKSLYKDKLLVPFDVYNDYTLPPYIGEHTLVILASYSGTTEETLSAAKQALACHACVTGITTGGALGALFDDHQIPYYKITPTHNPAGQPRMATGYSIVGQIAILSALGFLHVEPSDIEAITKTLAEKHALFSPKKETAENPAKTLVTKLEGKIPIIVSAEFLGNTGRIVQNYFHETGKCFSAFHIIPEMNHHLMEGLTNPKTNKDLLTFLFLTSRLYSKRTAERIAITKDVITKQHITVEEFIPQSDLPLVQLFECVQFAGYVTYYMAMMYDLDPSKIPWVDYFKKALTA